MANPNPSPREAPVNTFALAFEDYLNVNVDHLLRINKEKVTAKRAIVLEQVKKAVRGDLNSAREVMNRVEGMPKQATDLTSGGDKIQFVVTRGTT